MGRGRDADAVAVVHAVAAYNGTSSALTLEDLTKFGLSINRDAIGSVTEKEISTMATINTTPIGAIRRQITKFNADHIKALFKSKQLAWSTGLTIVIWGMLILPSG